MGPRRWVAVEIQRRGLGKSARHIARGIQRRAILRRVRLVAGGRRRGTTVRGNCQPLGRFHLGRGICGHLQPPGGVMRGPVGGDSFIREWLHKASEAKAGNRPRGRFLIQKERWHDCRITHGRPVEMRIV